MAVQKINSMVEGQLTRSEELTLVKSYGRFLKLCKSGFPKHDAKLMTGLNSQNLFEKASQVYQLYL